MTSIHSNRPIVLSLAHPALAPAAGYIVQQLHSSAEGFLSRSTRATRAK